MSEDNNTNSTKNTTHSNEVHITSTSTVFEKIIPALENDKEKSSIDVNEKNNDVSSNENIEEDLQSNLQISSSNSLKSSELNYEEEEEASLSDDVQQSKHSKTELVKLCENMDCERYPPDWDFEEDTEETYQEDQWKKCCLCDGYFNDDGMGDILFVQEEPNNQEAECDLCGKTEDIVQMKGSGQYLCGNACDESDESDESDDE
jgi:hypothetical protein